MATAGKICNRRVIVATPSEGLAKVAQRMLEEGVGCVVVVPADEQQPRKPIGMLTDRDIVVGLLARADRRIHTASVGDVMNAPVVTAWESEEVEDVLSRMRSFGVRRMPVVNDAGELEGLLSFDDWVEFLQERLSDLAALLQRESSNEAERRSY